ncbi:hypothetical protein BV25DRAFT_1915788 [Artomyces pyxidatus]|uniref:Uncharacterized protein n=1 Tax=Artomyces pyxidatus TaxID=48021 RepID=A0ACB8T1L5_9AGAM|nr:hypothetical protein BV25DRAFT_1915788 [Artomyces pyxidatus]
MTTVSKTKFSRSSTHVLRLCWRNSSCVAFSRFQKIFLPSYVTFQSSIPVCMLGCSPNALLSWAPITQLTLYDIEDLGNILLYLDGAPSLEILSIGVPSPESIDTTAPSTELPSLRRLDISADSIESITDFMACLDIPPNTALDLSLSSITEATSTTAMQGLAAVCADHISEASSEGLYYRDLTIGPSWGGDRSCCIILQNPDLVLGEDDVTAVKLPPQLRLSFSIRGNFSDERRILPRFLSFMPSTHSFHTLNTGGTRLRFMQDWLDIANHCSRAQQIHAEGLSAHGLVMALDQIAVPAFLHLETLCITGATFAEQVDERPAPPDYCCHWTKPQASVESPTVITEEPLIPADSFPFVDVLLRALRSRSKSGHPISHLSVSKCNVTAEMISSLRACLGEDAVEWDGQLAGGPRTTVS